MSDLAGGTEKPTIQNPFEQATTYSQIAEHQPDIVGWVLRRFRGRTFTAITLAAALGTSLGALFFFSTPREFESHATIRISDAQPFIMYEGETLASSAFSTFVKAQVDMLSSPELISRAADKIRENAPDSEISAIALSRSIGVDESKNIITISASANDEISAPLYANTLVDTYFAAQQEQAREQQNFRMGELTSREADLIERLERKENEILVLGGEYGIEYVEASQASTLEMLQNSNRAIDDLIRNLNELRTYGSYTVTGIADDELLEALVEDHALDLMLFEHSKRLSELARLEIRYQPSNRRVVELRASVQILEEAMEARREQIKALKMSGEIPADAATRQERIEELEQTLSQLRPQNQTLQEAARDLQSQRTQLNTLQEEADMLKDLLQEAQIELERLTFESRVATPGLVDIISRAPIPLEPKKDSRKTMGLIGFILGFAAVVGAYLARFILLPEIRFADDLLRFDPEAPLIGRLDATSDPRMGGPAVYRLRNNIQLAEIPAFDRNRRAKVLAVGACSTSTQSEPLAIQLAESFTAAGLRSLCIQTSSTPVQADQEYAGWHAFILDGVDSTSVTENGLHVMEGGLEDPFPDQRVSLDHVRKAVARLAEDFDVIVFDVGCYGEETANDFVVSQCDIALLTTRPSFTASPLREAVNHLKRLCPGRVRLVMTEPTAKKTAFA